MTNCPHCHTPLTAPVVSQVLADVRAIRSRGTATEVQEDRMLAALRAGPKTTDDFRKLGVYQASARVHYLRKRGYVIETELFDGFAADGYSHARMARYTLKEEPLALDASMARKTPPAPEQGQQSGEAECI